MEYVDSIQHVQVPSNHHILEIGKSLNGNSHMFDISKTAETGYVTTFQSGNDVVQAELPPVIIKILARISETFAIPTEHSYLQIVDTNSGGTIKPHYDISISGFINYKCNLSVLAEDYLFAIGSDTILVKQSDLYCFEASLYKHWTPNPFNSRRVLLSFGFLTEYSVTGRTSSDPRVRLSKRIEKYFQT